MLQGTERITGCDNADIEYAVIDVGIGGHFNNISIFACIAYDDLDGLPLPGEITVALITGSANFYREKLLLGNFFDGRKPDGKWANLIFHRFRNVLHDGGIDAWLAADRSLIGRRPDAEYDPNNSSVTQPTRRQPSNRR